MHKLILPVALIAFAIACGHQKHNSGKKPVSNNGLTWINDGKKADPNVNPESLPDYNPSLTRENDILHTKLEVRFDWAKRYLYGKATIAVRPYFYPTSTLVLDARGMEIRRIAELKQGTGFKEDTLALKYTYNGKKITIDLGRTMKRTDNYTVFIDYVSKPDELTDVGGSAAISQDKGLYFINPDGAVPNKPKQIWTQGETQANCVWMPTIDSPNEKMTDEIYMTVEDQYVTLSNGILSDSKKNIDGTRTDHWRMDTPHSAYLLMIAVGNFAIVKDKWRDKEVSYYVEPQYEPYARMTFGKTPEMIECFSKLLGVDYPWPKYSQICARDYVSGAMENTTATLHSDFLQRDDREFLDRTYEEYISHELFHQWFGDYVTSESWSNLPLNESFATYGEYLWDEYKYGKDIADIGHYASFQGYLQESGAGHPEWNGKREPLIRFHYEDREDMFDSHSYNKGGQVLHLLRQYVGDDAFFASLKLYLETNKYQTVEIGDLRLAFEKTTGRDMNWFFNEWFMSPGHPELDITYDYNAADAKQRVIIKQTQDRSNGTPVFRIPLNIDLYLNGKVERKAVIVTSVNDTFYLDAGTKPDFVNVDADKTLPCWKQDHHTPAEWAFLYDHSSLYVDKVEALNNLAPEPLKIEEKESAPAAEQLITRKVLAKAINDPSWAIREQACYALGDYANQTKDALIKLAKSDTKSNVRAAALYALSEGASGDELKDVYLGALNDKSYTVLSRGLTGLMDHFHETGMTETKKRENDPARGMRLAVASAYAHGGSEAQLPWYENAMDGLYGLYIGSFFGQYYDFLTERCSPATIEKALPALEKKHFDNSSTTARVGTYAVVARMLYVYKGKEKNIQKKIDDLKSVKSNATGIQKLETEKAEITHLIAALEASKKRISDE